jgi:hypothetical protein
MHRPAWSMRSARRWRFQPAPGFRFRPGPIGSVVGTAEQLMAGISSLLGISGSAAFAIASRVIAAEADLAAELRRRPPAGEPGALHSSTGRVDLGPLLALEEAATPYILALPFAVPSVMEVRELSRRTRRILLVEKTPLSEPIFQAIASETPGGMELLSPGELLRRNLTSRGPTSRRMTLVTFPDHHWTGEETSRPIRFFQEEHWFALLEPLLLIRGAYPILTLSPAEADGGKRLNWVKCSQSLAGRPVTEGAVRELLAWLAARLEATMRTWPTEVLSWGVVPARAVRARTTEYLLDRSVVAGFLRAWSAAAPASDRPLLADFLERLDRMEPDLPVSTVGARP